jgi:2,3-bisphosphoglycerate-dependent phosphoglycerate mutase
MLKKGIFLILTVLLITVLSTYAQKHTIWLVRHAEKSVVDQKDVDPELSEAGSQRATALNNLLKNKKISAIYTTNYNRTKATVAPLATALGITPMVYNPRETEAFAAALLKQSTGQDILIAGHSNTIIPLIKALGCKVPFETMSDDDYDMLFEVITDGNNQPRLFISNYGEKHHTTVISAAFAQPK